MLKREKLLFIEEIISLLDELIKIIIYLILTIVVLTINILIYIRIICNNTKNIMCK